jgi:hypothetical protein
MLAAQAWIVQGQGNSAEAEKLMRASADLEDRSEKHVAMENRLYPMRELLADLLMEQRKPAEALKHYQASLKAAPERCAASMAPPRPPKRPEIARWAWATIASWRGRPADGGRPELREVRQVLGQW